MDIVLSTLIGVFVIEGSFYLFHKIVDKPRFFSGFIATFVLAIIVLFFSFGNAISSILKHIALEGNNFTIWEVLLFGFNFFYGYMRGINRIAEINKKHGNL